MTLTFECGHRRYVSQLGNGALRDHVDAGSMMRSVHPIVTPLIADHYPEADCPSCRRVWLSGDKKVRFKEEDEDSDNDNDGRYDTADEGERDDKEEDEVNEDEDEIHKERTTLFEWRNRRTEVQGLLI